MSRIGIPTTAPRKIPSSQDSELCRSNLELTKLLPVVAVNYPWALIVLTSTFACAGS